MFDALNERWGLSTANAGERRQEDLIAQLTPSRRLQIAEELFQTAWELKRSGLRAQYPHWTEEQIFSKARRVFITGYAGA